MHLATSVYRYGRAAGLCFAAVQGGPYNGPHVTQLVDEIQSLGYTGVGQSSWGPTVFCVVEDQTAAERLQHELLSRRRTEPLEIVITPADNRGAVVSCDGTGRGSIQCPYPVFSGGWVMLVNW